MKKYRCLIHLEDETGYAEAENVEEARSLLDCSDCWTEQETHADPTDCEYFEEMKG